LTFTSAIVRIKVSVGWISFETMKYIIVEDRGTGLESGIIFSEYLIHKNVAGEQKVTAAGFCSLQDGVFVTWGESISLRVKSRPEDKQILNKSLSFRC